MPKYSVTTLFTICCSALMLMPLSCLAAATTNSNSASADIIRLRIALPVTEYAKPPAGLNKIVTFYQGGCRSGEMQINQAASKDLIATVNPKPQSVDIGAANWNGEVSWALVTKKPVCITNAQAKDTVGTFDPSSMEVNFHYSGYKTPIYFTYKLASSLSGTSVAYAKDSKKKYKFIGCINDISDIQSRYMVCCFSTDSSAKCQ